MSNQTYCPVGTAGVPWAAAEKRRWRAAQKVRRSYPGDVVARIDALRAHLDVHIYGTLDYAADGIFPLLAVRSRGWQEDLPVALVTGGVHGYETSGVHGALHFLEHHAHDYAGRVNLLVAPCVSPWGYERIHRWNPLALDPNRCFRAGSPAPEAAALWALVQPLRGRFVLHIDLHETTDTDESVFRPALAERDGRPFVPGTIPQGFYLVDDAENPQPAFQAAILDAVAQVTPIARADVDGTLIGSAMVAPGVIRYPVQALGLCAGITGARFTTTTEVYPDAPGVSPAQCNAAQVTAVRAALDFALSTPGACRA